MPKNVLFDRREVLQKVTALFWQKGFNGTSMQDLVDVTGLNRSSLYNSFGDKFQLYMEALKYYQETQNDLLSSRISSEESPKAALLSFFNSLKQNILCGGKQKGCFLTNCVSDHQDPQVVDFLVRNKESMVGLFKDLIQKAQKCGEISADKDAGHLALYLFSSLQGIRVTSMLSSDASDTEVITRQVLNSI